MPRWLALEYDRKQARLAVANVRADQLEIEHLLAVPLAEDDDPGEALAAAMREAKVGRGPALVSIPRASVELKPLTLPPAPDHELPELVRFQSLREFNALGEDWPLDYLPLTENAEEQRQVLAAAISPETVDGVRQLCQKLAVDPEQIVLRPCAAASLFGRREESKRQPMCLLVDLLPGEADLTAVVRGRVVFTRTAQMAHDAIGDPTNCRALIGEVRRSLAAVHNQVGHERVEAVYIWGDTPAHEELAQQLSANLELPVSTCPPLAGLQLAGSGQRTDRPEHFVSLLGALVDQAEKASPAFDFLNPRKTPPPPSQKRTILLAVAAAVAVVATGLWFLWSSLADWDRRIADADIQLKNTAPIVQEAKEVQARVDAVQAWQASNISWLDEMYYLSDRAPDFRQAVLTRLQSSSYVAGGGEIQLEGLVQQSSDVDELENSLRDEQHRVEAKSRQREVKNTRYAWRFRSQVVVPPQATDPLFSSPGVPVAKTAEEAGKAGADEPPPGRAAVPPEAVELSPTSAPAEVQDGPSSAAEDNS